MVVKEFSTGIPRNGALFFLFTIILVVYLISLFVNNGFILGMDEDRKTIVIGGTENPVGILADSFCFSIAIILFLIGAYTIVNWRGIKYILEEDSLKLIKGNKTKGISFKEIVNVDHVPGMFWGSSPVKGLNWVGEPMAFVSDTHAPSLIVVYTSTEKFVLTPKDPHELFENSYQRGLVIVPNKKLFDRLMQLKKLTKEPIFFSSDKDRIIAYRTYSLMMIKAEINPKTLGYKVSGEASMRSWFLFRSLPFAGFYLWLKNKRIKQMEQQLLSITQ